MVKPMHVFLSYNNRDRRIAERICEALKQARPDLDIYFAPERNQIGAYWMDLLGQELAQTDAVILLLGDKVGDWQEIEYYDALKRNRKAGRPIIAPIALAERLPGLPFLDHFHRLIFERHTFEELVNQLLSAMDGAGVPAGAEDEPLWRQVNPYAGLPAMQTEDSAFFVGREDLTASVIEALRQRPDRIHTLIGSSGVGKSSVAFAGVLAALRSRMWPGDVDRDWPVDIDSSPGWLPVVVTPGVKPTKELARSIVKTWLDSPSEIEREASAWAKLFHDGSELTELARAAREEIARRTGADPPAKALLYVDQGEELYTRADPADAAVFSRLLAGAIGHPDVMMMASLRADYYGQWQADEPFFRNGDRIDVPPLTKEQIERVVREPAARLGVRFENPDIVGVIAEATWKEPGGLPMLSYLMQDAWEEMRRDDASKGVLHFPFRVVDVSRPLVDRAERFIELHPNDTDTLRRLLTLRLAHVPREGQPVRRRAQRSDCTDAEWALVDELAGGDWRLLTTSDADEEPVAEVAHEALLRHWPRLSQWLDAERDFLIWKGQLETARLAWEDADDGQKDQALLMGLALTTAREWRADRGDELSETNRAFIDSSIDQADRAKQRRARQRKWIRGSAAAAIVLLVAFSAAAAWQAVVAEQQRDQAEAASAEAARQAELAQQQRDQAEVALFQAQVEQARSRAILAEMLLKDGNVGEAIDVARRAMPQYHGGDWPNVADIMEVPRVLAAALMERRETMVLDGHDSFVTTADFSTDGTRILTTSFDGSARLWDTESGSVIASLGGPELAVAHAEFLPDSGQIMAVFEDGTVQTLGPGGEEIAAELAIPEDNGFMAFDPNGTSVATAARDGSVHLWDMATGSENEALAGHDSTVTFAAFSADGSMIVTTSKDATARVWDTQTGDQITVLDGRSGTLTSAVFSPDSDRIVTVSSNNTARLWDADTGARIAVLLGHEGEIINAVFSPESSMVATLSSDDTARL
ncbi:MAG: TIR domain-containing protein, partial [Pseudomonadota bacterium]